MKCNHTSTRTRYDCCRGQELTEPVPIITAGTSKRPGGNGHALGMVEASLTPFVVGAGGLKYSAKPRRVEQPLNTICNTNHSCVIAPVIARQFGAGIGHRTDEPSATITAGGLHFGEVCTCLALEGYDEHRAQQTLAFLREYCSPDCDGLVTIDC